jgi:hypothetical protein
MCRRRKRDLRGPRNQGKKFYKSTARNAGPLIQAAAESIGAVHRPSGAPLCMQPSGFFSTAGPTSVNKILPCARPTAANFLPRALDVPLVFESFRHILLGAAGTKH